MLDCELEHRQMRAEGWSFIEYVGGPRDGCCSYFKGSPRWKSSFCDASVDPLKYKPGDLEHGYELREGQDGYAIYQYIGIFRRTEEV